MSSASAASIRPSSKIDPTAILVLGLLIGLSACHAAPKPSAAPAPPPLDAVGRLQHEVETVVSAAALERSYWGIVIRSATRGDTLYERNARKLLMPGSTMKIMTLAAAAERLGWDHAFETRILATGTIAGSVLEGDLLVVGSGDPSITATGATGLFAKAVEALHAEGVRAIAGRVVGDDNVFDDEGLGPGWAWDDLAGRDAVATSGLQFNENTVEATIVPGAAVGVPARVTLTPAGSSMYLDNQLTTTAEGGLPSIRARRSPGSNRLELRGTIPLAAEPIVRIFSVDNPTLFFASALRLALTAAGIDVRGPSIDVDELAAPLSHEAMVVATHRSAPLSQLAVRLMKDSQNLYAETLLKTIGALAGDSSLETSRLIMAATFAAWGVIPEDVVQVDGSGLSRYNYLTPEALATVLMRAHRDERLRAPFEAALPVAGRDGTLAGRMLGTPAEGNARAKTGTLANVRSLAGYVESAGGETLVFAILANNYGTMPEAAIAAIDEIVVRLAQFKR